MCQLRSHSIAQLHAYLQHSLLAQSRQSKIILFINRSSRLNTQLNIAVLRRRRRHGVTKRGVGTVILHKRKKEKSYLAPVMCAGRKGKKEKKGTAQINKNPKNQILR